MDDDLRNWAGGLLTVGMPDEFDAKALLGRAGIEVPDGIRVAAHEDVESLPFAANAVIKVCSPELGHKTDVGGVLLDVAPANLAEAVAEMRSRFPGKPLLVERLVRHEGPEMIVGGLVDATFGPVVMAGSGGVYTEVRRDAVFRLAPCSEAEARRMVSELEVAPLFDGFRGMRLDADGFARVVARVSRLVDRLGEQLEELDVNPVVCAGGRWLALDARITLRSFAGV
jgi:succinyl-CoA synthetase beta subunit